MKDRDIRDIVLMVVLLGLIVVGAFHEMSQECDGIRPNVTYCKVTRR